MFFPSHTLIFSDTIPPFIRNRLLFRYHIDRTLYFLEQGSVKGVKKEVDFCREFHIGKKLE